MSQKLSRTAQRMVAAAFADREVVFDKYGVTIGGIVFLLNDRAIGRLNQQAHENAGQYVGASEGETK